MSKRKKQQHESRVMRTATDGKRIAATFGALIHDMNLLTQRSELLANYLGWCLEKLGNEDYLKRKAEADAKIAAAARGEQITDAGLAIPANAGEIILTDGPK